MIGLGYLVFSIITIAIYFGWLVLVIKVLAFGGFDGFIRIVKILLAVFFVLFPLRSALVYPLVRNECDRNSHEILHVNESILPRYFVVEDSYSNGSFELIMNLFSIDKIDSIYFGRGADYGDADQIAQEAKIYDRRPFNLARSNQDDLACGPYYKYIEKQKNGSPIDSQQCLAISSSLRPDKYLRLKRMVKVESSWRTAFQKIEWNIIRFDLVTPEKSSKVYEIKEFFHDGMAFPLVFNLTPIGSYSCRSGKNVNSIVSDLFLDGTFPRLESGLSSEQSKVNLDKLKNKFWGFDLSDGMYFYRININDRYNISTTRKPISATLKFEDQGLPIFVELKNSSYVDWKVDSDKKQIILVEQIYPRVGDAVQGLSKNRTWKFDDDFKANPVSMFYRQELEDIKKIAIEQKRICEVDIIPREITSTIELGSCTK